MDNIYESKLGNILIDIRVNDINEIPKNVESVVIYCRVSTTHDAQEMSLRAQMDSAVAYAVNRGYFIVGIFVERESAKSDINRDAYMKMLYCVKEFQPTYILAKSSDRVARSTEVAASLQKICRNSGTKIQYVISGRVFDPYNPDDIMLSSFESTANEHVSLVQYRKAMEVNKRKREKPWLTANNECFGYRFNKELKRMEVYEPEARYVRRIFEKYVFEGMGTTAIAKYLADNGITGYKSNSLISESGILKWLKNEAYIGKMHIFTRATEFNFGVGVKSRRYELPPEKHVIVEVPRIVDDEIFSLAQEIMKDKRRLHASTTDMSPENIKANFRGKHLFAHKVFCGECGISMLFKYADQKKTVGIYKCSAKKKAKRKEHNKNYSSDDVITCNNSFGKIREDILIDIVEKALSYYASYEEEIYANLFKAIETVLKNKKMEKNSCIEPLKKELQAVKNEYEKAKKAYMRTELEELAREIQEECKTLLNRIHFLEEEITIESEQENVIYDNRFKIESARNYLKELQNHEEIDRDGVLRYIDKILVHNDGKVEVYLKYNKIYAAIVQQGKKGEQSLLLNLKKGNKNTRGMMVLYPQVMLMVLRI